MHHPLDKRFVPGTDRELILLFAKPDLLLDLGFEFSFVSVAVLLLATPTVAQSVVLAHGWLRWLFYWCVGIVGTSFLVGVATLPIYAHNFGSVALLAPLTNVLAIAVTTLVAMPGSMALMLLTPWKHSVWAQQVGRWLLQPLLASP